MRTHPFHRFTNNMTRSDPALTGSFLLPNNYAMLKKRIQQNPQHVYTTQAHL